MSCRGAPDFSRRYRRGASKAAGLSRRWRVNRIGRAGRGVSLLGMLGANQRASCWPKNSLLCHSPPIARQLKATTTNNARGMQNGDHYLAAIVVPTLWSLLCCAHVGDKKCAVAARAHAPMTEIVWPTCGCVCASSAQCVWRANQRKRSAPVGVARPSCAKWAVGGGWRRPRRSSAGEMASTRALDIAEQRSIYVGRRAPRMASGQEIEGSAPL